MKVFHSGKKTNPIIILQGLVILLVCGVALTEFYFIHEMKKNLLDSIGKRALSIAVVTAKDIQISNAEAERLIDLDFPDLLTDPVNVAFENDRREIMRYAHVKYIYVMRQLPPEQVKYAVGEEEEEYFGLPAGANLDTIYLLDAVIDNETRLEDTDGQWYTDKDRYTTLREPEAKAYYSQSASFSISNDEWGSYVSGYAPLYSTEGEYIGILGADIFFDEYSQTISRQVTIISIFFVLSVLLGIVFSYILIHTKKTEEDAKLFKQKSYYDDMTEMYNRRMLNENADFYWHEALSRKISLAAIMMDIDHFKHYNDAYGHAIGDKIIINVASVIQHCVREGKDLSFRYGGDEFLVLIFDTEISVISMLAQRIQNHLKSITIEGLQEQITLSFGISSVLPSRGTNLSMLISQADQSLYRSKRNGGDQISIYQGEMFGKFYE